MDFNRRRVLSIFGCHASIKDLLSIDGRTLQIVVITSSGFVSVAPYSLVCWMVMGSKTCRYVLNAMLRNLELKEACEDSISFLLLYLDDLSIFQPF